MGDAFESFRRFSDTELANAFGERLNESEIPFEIIKEPQMLDAGIIGTSSLPDIVLKIRAKDFSKAHDALAAYYKDGLELVEKDYYLFSFRDAELYEILAKPDEWGYFDYLLAQIILNDRGHNVDSASLDRFKTERINHLRKPEKVNIALYIIACIFILNGLIYCLIPVINIESLVFCSPAISFLIGRHIFRNTRTLMDGQKTFTYLTSDRKHGKLIMYMGLALFLTSLFKFLLLFVSFNN